MINEGYLSTLMRDLHNAEHDLFTHTKMDDDRLVKLYQLKMKQISHLKYSVQKLKELLEKIDYQVKHPKLKVVGI